MTNLLNFIEKPTLPRGLDPYNKIIKNNLLNHLFEKELIDLENLKPTNLNIKENPILLYAGSGSDIIYPLFFLTKLFPDIKKANFIFIDLHNHLGMIKSILDDIGISFEENNQEIKFHYDHSLITLRFVVESIFTTTLPEYDIYFERKFRIMKDYDETYEDKIFNNLNNNGFIISDSGFQKNNLKNIPIIPELSVYNEMIIGKKII